ncbi:Uncharacterised protein [Serratia quinivorans]|nr:Uncharacterised protein [Serratia quinivorans]
MQRRFLRNKKIMMQALTNDHRVFAPEDFPFSGIWRLQPELSNYEFGISPRDGTYEVSLDSEDWLVITSRWSNVTGRFHEANFEGVLGGGLFPYYSYEAADELYFEFVQPDILRSAAFKNGIKVHWAERRLCDSGNLMTIKVFGLRAGRVYGNADVYKRVCSPPLEYSKKINKNDF